MDLTGTCKLEAGNGKLESARAMSERWQAVRVGAPPQTKKMQTVIVNMRGEARIESGHPWIYRSDIAEVRAAAGDIVRVSGPRNRVLGEALFSDRSQITLRMLTRGEAPADEALLRRRIDQAIRFRETLKIEGDAYRLIH